MESRIREGDIVSLEGVTMLDPDYIYIVDHVEDFDAHVTELNKSKVWKSLKAVKKIPCLSAGCIFQHARTAGY